MSDIPIDENVVIRGDARYLPKNEGPAGDISKAYKEDDPVETNLADGDYVPFYDTSAGAKKKTLWSNIKEKLKNFFLPLFKTTTLDVDNMTEDGLWWVNGAITGAPTNNYGLLLNVKSMGTPFQMFFPDALLDVYKRYYTNGAWTAWQKIKSSYADSAGSAIDAVNASYAASAGSANNATKATLALKLGSGGSDAYPMQFNWTGQSGQPTWVWGGNEYANIYVYNPSNFTVKRAKELNYATDTSDKNTDNGNGWYSVGEAANANYDSHKPLAINWYWGIDIRTRGIAYTKINGYEILTKEKSSSYITINHITGTITKKHGSSASITAPTLSGYTFKCWLSVASDGWVGNLYIQSPDNSATRIWSANYGYNDTSTGNFIAYALYIISN